MLYCRVARRPFVPEARAQPLKYDKQDFVKKSRIKEHNDYFMVILGITSQLFTTVVQNSLDFWAVSRPSNPP